MDKVTIKHAMARIARLRAMDEEELRACLEDSPQLKEALDALPEPMTPSEDRGRVQALGAKIKEARLAAGVTYYQILKDLGMSVAMTKRIEEGRGPLSNIVRLCEYLNLKIEL